MMSSSAPFLGGGGGEGGRIGGGGYIHSSDTEHDLKIYCNTAYSGDM